MHEEKRRQEQKADLFLMQRSCCPLAVILAWIGRKYWQNSKEKLEKPMASNEAYLGAKSGAKLGELSSPESLGP